MGSFYATCSITKTTIGSGDKTTLQFMVPTKVKGDSGSMFVKIFLENVKEKGLEEATKIWTESTKRWGDSMNWKGMDVSNDGSYADYIPIGPAIKGTYSDYGNIDLDQSEENQKNVKILQDILCVPFESIMDVATDDRWYTLGINEKKKDWQVKHVDEKTPQWLVKVFKLLTVTYIRTEVYDQICNFEFDAEDGTPREYSRKWKNEYITKAKKELKNLMKRYAHMGVKNPAKKAAGRIKAVAVSVDYHYLGSLNHIILNDNLHATYVGGLIKSKEHGTDWFLNQLIFMYNLGGMCMRLERSQYGSQHLNWKGFNIIIKNLPLEQPVEEE